MFLALTLRTEWEIYISDCCTAFLEGLIAIGKICPAQWVTLYLPRPVFFFFGALTVDTLLNH